jgi:Protein of unknown function (DUF3309)
LPAGVRSPARNLRTSWCSNQQREVRKGDTTVSITTILLIILILVLVGALPSWPYSRSWGYAPSGVLGAVVLVLIILLLLGRI